MRWPSGFCTGSLPGQPVPAMIVCPFCLAHLDRDAVTCPHCNAMRGYRVFGGAPDRPAVAWLKAVILPLSLLPACAVGFVMKSTPLWLGVAGLALVFAALGVRQVMSGSHWYRF